MTQPAPPKPHALIHSITGLRGFAALLVVWAHMDVAGVLTAYTPFAGEIGVAVFFSLSGFLMAMLYMRKAFNAKAVGRYVVARFARIAPAYLFVVIVSFLVFELVDPHFVYAITPSKLLRHLLFSGNVAVLWSIPPEVQFYVLFVGLWFAAHALIVDKTWRWVILAAVVALALYLTRHSVPGTFVGSKIDFFVLGVGTGLLRSHLRPSTAPMALILVGQSAVLAFFLAIVCGFVPLTFATKDAFYYDPLTALIASFGVLCFSFSSPLSRVVFETRPALAFGTWSFSIYLLNEIVIYWVGKDLVPNRLINAAAIVAAILALSWICNRLIELPGAALLRRVAEALPEMFRAPDSAVARKPIDP